MRAYKVELLIIDHDELGEDVIRDTLENTRYPNHCMSPHVRAVKSADIGEWHDDHPLNKIGVTKDAVDAYFGEPKPAPVEKCLVCGSSAMNYGCPLTCATCGAEVPMSGIKTRSLGEALPDEIARVREILGQYRSIGVAGRLGAALIERDLDQAVRALAEGDVVAMARAYAKLKGIVE